MELEDLCSVFRYEESQSLEEMKRKLVNTNLELERMKMEAGKELKRHEDRIKQLIGLIQIANQERDDARAQLQNLLDKLSAPNPGFFDDLGGCPAFSIGLQQPDNILFPAGKANSGVTESNNSHSPAESLMEAISSPDPISLSLVNQQPNGYLQDIAPATSPFPKVDPMAAIFDDLAKRNTLPQKGKLLQAVQDAGPLLINLLVAGPLPRWRNPPPLQPLRAPPVSITNGCDTGSRPVTGLSGFNARKRSRLAPFNDIPCGNTQTSPSSMLSFMGSTGFSYNSSHLPSYGLTTGQWPMATRQRLH